MWKGSNEETRPIVCSSFFCPTFSLTSSTDIVRGHAAPGPILETSKAVKQFSVAIQSIIEKVINYLHIINPFTHGSLVWRFVEANWVLVISGRTTFHSTSRGTYLCLTTPPQWSRVSSRWNCHSVFKHDSKSNQRTYSIQRQSTTTGWPIQAWGRSTPTFIRIGF